MRLTLGDPFNIIKSVCPNSQCSHLINVVLTFLPTGRMLKRFRCLHIFLKQLSQSRLSLFLLAMSIRIYLFFPPRGRKPPPTLRDRLNPHPRLQRRAFQSPLGARVLNLHRDHEYLRNKRPANLRKKQFN